MKPILFWIAGIIIGALIGYAVSLLTGFMLLIPIGIGIILGSTTAITINMQQRKYRKLQEKTIRRMEKHQEIKKSKNSDNG